MQVIAILATLNKGLITQKLFQLEFVFKYVAQLFCPQLQDGTQFGVLLHTISE